MKILILTSSHPKKIAGIVAYDLFKGLKNIEGNEVRILTKAWDKYDNKEIIPIDSSFSEYKHRIFVLFKRIKNKLLKVFLGITVNNEPQIKTDPDYAMMVPDQTITYYNTKRIIKRAGFSPDAIIVLFMPNFISYRNLYELNLLTKAPIFLYLMDMAPLTGGCHYAWDCRGYIEKCGKCPALFSKDEQDQSRINWHFKKKCVDKMNIIPIAASEWQWRQLNENSIFETKKKIKILSPTNEFLFYPDDKIRAKQIFSISIEKRVIFIGSAYNKFRGKGLEERKKALDILYQMIEPSERSQILILIAGQNSETQGDYKFETKSLGHLNHKELAIAYQASDVFLNSSIEDSGPTMINQSIMSGTPVVAFEMGVAPDLVKNGYTGYMAKLKDPYDLARGLYQILYLPEDAYETMSINCRKLALDVCSLKTVINELSILLNKK
jgi:glycosyltransferase involved in cell wall biosynthesis